MSEQEQAVAKRRISKRNGARYSRQKLRCRQGAAGISSRHDSTRVEAMPFHGARPQTHRPAVERLRQFHAAGDLKEELVSALNVPSPSGEAN